MMNQALGILWQGHLPPGLKFMASPLAVGGWLSSRQYNKVVFPLPSTQDPENPVFYSWKNMKGFLNSSLATNPTVLSLEDDKYKML